MGAHHITAGILLLLATVILFGLKYVLTPKPGRFRAWGWAGLAVILLAEWLLFRGVRWVVVFFTPLAWTGYLLLVDAMVSSLRGRSRLSNSPREFFSLVFWSFPLWLIFEAYNLRLKNWTYVGLPLDPIVCGVGYVWSFATIWPAIHETADLVRALGFWGDAGKPRDALSRARLASLAVLGLLLVTLPVLLPVRAGQFLFGAVWMGFVPLLDPINYHLQGRSLLRDWEQGETATFRSFLLSGLVCGILWEFWNYWAGARWLYIFPIGQGSKIFEMPLLGYLGFPPFALECFVMYEFIRTLRRRLAGFSRQFDGGRRSISDRDPRVHDIGADRHVRPESQS